MIRIKVDLHGFQLILIKDHKSQALQTRISDRPLRWLPANSEETMTPFKLHSSAIDPIKTGLALGALIGLWHLSWSILVAFGGAQPFIDFVFWMHFLKPPYVVQPFNFVTAAVLLVVTLSLGFVLGSIFAVLWNWIHNR